MDPKSRASLTSRHLKENSMLHYFIIDRHVQDFRQHLPFGNIRRIADSIVATSVEGRTRSIPGLKKPQKR
jgi:hypothetical protein